METKVVSKPQPESGDKPAIDAKHKENTLSFGIQKTSSKSEKESSLSLLSYWEEDDGDDKYYNEEELTRMLAANPPGLDAEIAAMDPDTAKMVQILRQKMGDEQLTVLLRTIE